MERIMEENSRAKEISILLKKQQGLMKEYYNLAKFKEPIAMLHRRTGRIHFFEDATKGAFKFIHTSGDERTIILDPTFIKTFDYGKNTFRGYWLDEDNATPLPDKPLLSSELHAININKTLNDQKNWQAKEIEARGNMIWAILIGLAIVGFVIGMYVIPALKQGNPQPAVQVIKPAITNATTTIFT